MIHVLTYNISWATQANKVAGSESDFVEACQKKYKAGGLECHRQAISNLSKVGPIHLLGLQEVNSDIEPFIQKHLPNLTQYIDQEVIQDNQGNITGKPPTSSVQTMWDPDVVGHLQNHTKCNLGNKKDIRMCCILHLKKKDTDIIVINLHAPWAHNNKNGNKIQICSKIYNHLKTKAKPIQHVMQHPDCKIICMGDFNDPHTRISKYRPLKLRVGEKEIRLSQQRSKKTLRNYLKTCCWHKVGFVGKFEGSTYSHFTDTGDYVLVNHNCRVVDIRVPKIYNSLDRNKSLFSDHKPVLVKLDL
jgi:endonuclease/exonuclease/phosphatase family metal-dependent hydrolase